MNLGTGNTTYEMRGRPAGARKHSIYRMGGRPAGARNVLDRMCKSFEGMWPKSVLRNMEYRRASSGIPQGVLTTAGKYGSRYIYLGQPHGPIRPPERELVSNQGPPAVFLSGGRPIVRPSELYGHQNSPTKRKL